MAARSSTTGVARGAAAWAFRSTRSKRGRCVASGAEGSARGRRLLRLSPQDRLRKRFEFGRARDQGRRVHTQSFVLLIRPNQLDRTRLGLTVSHKVGNAVRRNRIKRLVREVFRQQDRKSTRLNSSHLVIS